MQNTTQERKTKIKENKIKQKHKYRKNLREGKEREIKKKAKTNKEGKKIVIYPNDVGNRFF